MFRGRGLTPPVLMLEHSPSISFLPLLTRWRPGPYCWRHVVALRRSNILVPSVRRWNATSAQLPRASSKNVLCGINDVIHDDKRVQKQDKLVPLCPTTPFACSSDTVNKLLFSQPLVKTTDMIFAAYLMYKRFHHFNSFSFQRLFDFIDQRASSLLTSHAPPLPQLLRHILNPQTRDQSCREYFKRLCQKYEIVAENASYRGFVCLPTQPPEAESEQASTEHLATRGPPTSGFDTVTSIPAAGDGSNGRPKQVANVQPSRRATTYARYTETLTHDVLDLDQWLRPDPWLMTAKRGLMNRLRQIMGNDYGEQTMHAFGSTENGFCIRTSDIDVCLVIPACVSRDQQFSALQKLRRSIIKSLPTFSRYNVKKCFLINARVPIIKLCDGSGHEMCDISINNTTALDNSRLVSFFGHYDRRVRTLGRLLKFWATKRHINYRVQGTLSTYALLLLLFFFLQRRSPPILPLYNMITKDAALRFLKLHPDILTQLLEQQVLFEAPDIILATTTRSAALIRKRVPNALVKETLNSAPHPTKLDMAIQYLCQSSNRSTPFVNNIHFIKKYLVPSSCNTSNEETVGELLYEFFQFYGSRMFYPPHYSAVDNENTPSTQPSETSGWSINLVSGELEKRTLPFLHATCPISNICVNPFTSAKWKLIFHEFERAKNLMEENFPLEELCKDTRPSKLADDTKDSKLDRNYNARLSTVGEFVRILSSMEEHLLPPSAL